MKCLLSLIVLAFLVVPPLQLKADIVENFDDISTLAGDGWAFENNSTDLGTVPDWSQGTDTVFPSQAGDPTAYISVNFNSTTENTISNWMITPETTLENGSVLSFWTRTVAGSTFPDRLQVRMSTNGASVDVGTSPTDVGDFTDLLLDINPDLLEGPANYPEDWTQFTLTVSGLGGPESGRFAFRYFVADGGPFGSNSNYIGVDTVQFTTAIPEPASTLFLTGLGLTACLIRRRIG